MNNIVALAVAFALWGMYCYVIPFCLAPPLVEWLPICLCWWTTPGLPLVMFFSGACWWLLGISFSGASWEKCNCHGLLEQPSQFLSRFQWHIHLHFMHAKWKKNKKKREKVNQPFFLTCRNNCPYSASRWGSDPQSIASSCRTRKR